MKFKYFAMAALVFGSLAFISCGDDKKESGDKDQKEDVNSSSEGKEDENSSSEGKEDVNSSYDYKNQKGSMSDDLEEWTTVEQEAEEFCELACEFQSLQERAMNGEDVEAEGLKLGEVIGERSSELQMKYGDYGDASDEDKAVFMEIMENCDCF